MHNNVCIYENKLYLVSDTCLVAYSYIQYPKSQSENFLECFKVKLPVKNLYVSDVKLEVVENYITGIKSLVILLFDLNRLCNIFIYGSSWRKKLYQISLPNWSADFECYSSNLFISDGPTFLFHSAGAFHLHIVPCGISNSFDCKFHLSDSKEYNVLQFKSLSILNSGCRKQFLFLLIVCATFSCHQKIKIIGFVSEINEPTIICDQLCLQIFFPKFYEAFLKTIQVTNAVPVSQTKTLSIKDMEWKETACVICTRDDCLIFSNASLKYCCKLTVPLVNIMCMKGVFSSTFLENFNVVLSLENKTVFFLSMKSNMKLEVVKHLTDIEATITGEILMKGSKQILLLKQTDVDSWQKSCILYDMSSFILVDLNSHNVIPDNCLKTTITGLSKKVQIGKSAIKDIEHEISQKSAATIDALIKLNEFNVNNESSKCSSTFQESLVDLILSKDENKTENFPTKSQSVKLLDEKQQFIDDQWIINLCFINGNERDICNPSIKVLMKDSQVIFLYRKTCCLLEHYNKE